MTFKYTPAVQSANQRLAEGEQAPVYKYDVVCAKCGSKEFTYIPVASQGIPNVSPPDGI